MSPEKSYTRKIREILLSYRIEENLTKEQILYLYLNQIYLGQGAYGVEAAAQSYYRKPIKKATLAEMTILAGLPQAPSRYSPITNPSSAKQRQRYVLDRMAAEGFIEPEVAKKTAEEPVVIYVREKYEDMAPYFLETLRQNLVSELGESTVLDKGIKIQTTLDLEKQLAAQEGVQKGLRDLDKKQGYRGAAQTLQGQDAMDAFLKKTRAALVDEKTPIRVLMADGSLIAYEDFQKWKAQQNPTTAAKAKNNPAKPARLLPWFLKIGEVVHGVVTRVDDIQGLVHVQLPDCMGLIDIKTMAWARKPDSKVRFYQAQITIPSVALKPGDVVEVRIANEKFDPSDFQDRVAALGKGQKNPPALKDVPKFDQYLGLELEQEPEVEGALISYDLKKQDVLAMVGGYDFRKSKFNRAIQAARQTGSSFKPIVFAAALDSGFTPASVIYDAPIVFKDEASKSKVQKGIKEDEDQDTTWKPANYGAKFGGDILLRDALVQSKNVPTVRIMDKVGVTKVNEYSRRLGIFSPLNLDLSMGLGSSSVTLYEMTKVMGTFANGGRRLRPRMLISVKGRDGKLLLENVTLDQRFQTQLQALELENEEKRKQFLEKLALAAAEAERGSAGTPPESENEAEALAQRLKQFRRIYFEDPDQLMSPQTAFLITNLLTGVINDPNGTGGRARALGKTIAGKTGSTSDYYDAWFVGYSPSVATGVWVGFDSERSMGVGATGGEAALPIWMHYMQTALKDVGDEEFPTPPGIVFANIDKDTGKLASAKSKRIYRQAFLQGTEPNSTSEQAAPEQEKDMMKDEIQ